MSLNLIFTRLKDTFKQVRMPGKFPFKRGPLLILMNERTNPLCNGAREPTHLVSQGALLPIPIVVSPGKPVQVASSSLRCVMEEAHCCCFLWISAGKGRQNIAEDRCAETMLSNTFRLSNTNHSPTGSLHLLEIPHFLEVLHGFIVSQSMPLHYLFIPPLFHPHRKPQAHCVLFLT